MIDHLLVSGEIESFVEGLISGLFPLDVEESVI